MRTSDCDILIVPGLGNSGPGHWQSRWERQLSTARRVEQSRWADPDREAWVEALVEAVRRGGPRPRIVVAHSLGVIALAWAAAQLSSALVRGAFLVTPPDVEDPGRAPPELRSFAPIPRDPLPFPSVLVASRTDPYCSYERAEDMGYAWGAATVDAGDVGHLNDDSGHGPWPEGLMRFAGFLRKL